MSIIDADNNIVHMSVEEAETYEEERHHCDPVKNFPPKEMDKDLGLAVVAKPTIFEKYGVHCDPKKNNFHRSLYEQYEMRGALSIKQINALRR